MVKIVHMMPGRLRLRFEPLKGRPELATKLRAHLSEVSGLGRVEVNARTGSVLLLYNARALGSSDFIDAISVAFGKLFPAHFAPGRLRVTISHLKGRPELARKIVEHLSPMQGIDQIEIDPSTGSCQLLYDSRVVTTPEFLDALSPRLSALLPKKSVRSFLSRAFAV